MKNYKQILVSLSISSFLFSGCFSTNNNIEVMEQTKQHKSKANIHISTDTGYKAYLDSDNNLKYICMNRYGSCNYYSSKKDSYNNGTPDEEYVLINQDGYYPPLSPDTKNIQCGTGSLAGWLIILGNRFGIKDYTKKHPLQCNSRFTSVT